MSKKFLKNPRKTIAIALVGLGLAGVSVASAATLLLEGGSNSLAQAGTTDLSFSQCQDPETAINVYYGLVDGSGNSIAGALVTGDVSTFGYPEVNDTIVLDSIDAACEGKTLKVAVGDGLGELIAEYTGTVPTGGGVVALHSDGWVAGPAWGNLADMERVSVTILD